MKKQLAIITLAAIGIGLYACGGGGNKPAPGTEVPPPEAPAQMSEGKALFVSNCAICHNLTTDKTGPALKGVLSRWNNDTAKLKKYIHNSPAMIQSGDEYTNKLYKKYGNAMMTPFPNLTDDELNHIIEYIDKGEE